jgi:hypothetical protein
MRMKTIHATALVVLLTSGLAAAAPERPLPQKLGLLAGAGYLGSPGMNGAAGVVGVRYLPIKYLALSFDFGWGVIGRMPDVQDRWWLMPSVAVVVPAGQRVRLDFGAGVGFATSSGYPSWSAFTSGPFEPVWAYQLAPALRGHAMALVTLTGRVDLFVRFDVGSLLLDDNSIGIRVPGPRPSKTDTVFYDLLVGVHFRLL